MCRWLLAFLFYSSGDSLYALIALLLAGCCAGFLPWNLGRARVFMGDVGSLALGFLLLPCCCMGSAPELSPRRWRWLVMLLFLTDSTLTLLSRVMQG